MHFKKNKKQTNRSRQPLSRIDESFRRNSIVVSRGQREVRAHQQTVTQRQHTLKQQQRHQRRRIRIVFIGIVVLLVLFVLRMQISGVGITSDPPFRLTPSQKNHYSQIIEEQVNAHTLLRQSWLLDSQKLSKNVIAEHPEIQSIDFVSHAPFGSTLEAHITFRKAVFVWVDGANVTQFVDKDGVLFTSNLDGSLSVAKLVHIEDQSGVVLRPGASVLTGNLVQFVGKIHTQILAAYGAGSQIQRIIIPRSTREVDVQVAGAPYLVRFSSQRSIEEQVGDLKILLTFLQQQNITPASYIDLRLPHKAFYK